MHTLKPEGAEFDVRETAIKLVTDQTYQDKLLKRLQAGEAGAIEVWLWRWAGGDPKRSSDSQGAAEKAHYDELRRVAEGLMRRERAHHTLRPTALVHEAYLRLVGEAATRPWESRAHFFGVASRAMRQILVDHARERAADKRGGGLRRTDRVDSNRRRRTWSERAPPTTPSG